MNNKKFKVKDPLYWGCIWDKRYMSDKQKEKVGLKKYKFKRTNKSKKYHTYQCDFWNNRLELMIGKNCIAIDCYNLDENQAIFSTTLNIGSIFYLEEIKWYVKTMKNIHKAVKNNKNSLDIETYYYRAKNQYINNAFEFEKKEFEGEEEITKNIVFWDDENGGVIEITCGYTKDFLPNIDLKYENKKVYFPIVNKHLSIPIDLMEEILKEMESIKYEEFNE